MNKKVDVIGKWVLASVLMASVSYPAASWARPSHPSRSTGASKQAKPVDLTALLMNQLFASIGRPNFQARFNFSFGSKGSNLKELSGKFQVPFTRSISGVPLAGQGSGSHSDVDQVAPVLDVNTKDLVVNWSVNSHLERGRKIISNFIQFQTTSGRGAALVGTVHSPVAEYLQISVSAVKIDIEEGEENGTFEIEGQCDSTQVVVNISTGKADEVPVLCKLVGSVNSGKGDYDFNFTYDSMGK
jgi:hypothetical protein